MSNQELRGKARKLKAIKNQGWRCIWCGGLIQITDHNAKDYGSWEHLIPKSLGGLNYVEEFPGEKHNLAIAHSQCNSLRSSDLSWLPVIPLSKKQERSIRYAQYKSGVRDSLTRINMKQQKVIQDDD